MRDSGLLHQLLGINDEVDLLTHPKIGASWEGYAIEEVLAAEQAEKVHFWATHQGAEIDLLLHKKGKMFGVECKRSDTPKITPSIRSALADLKLDSIAIVYPGSKRFRLSDQVEAVPLTAIANEGVFINE
ncbi:MAG: putative AAA+ superfamily ATPase [Planctomycetota bacterium]